MNKHRYSNNMVLLIPDVHAPYHHKDALAFIFAVAQKYAPDRIIQMGDITDSYCFSRYPKDMEHPDSFSDEYRKVRKFVKDMTTELPNGLLVKGNHDARLWERAKVAGVPRGYILPFEDIIGLPDGWKASHDYSLTTDATRARWYFCHNKGSNPLNLAKQLGCSVAMGHMHTKFVVDCFASLDNKRHWGVLCGSLIGDNKYAFAYNRRSFVAPNRGCIVIERGVPRMIPMDLGPKGSWNKVVA